MEQNLYLLIGLCGAVIFFLGFMTGSVCEQKEED